jgi:hypothetical protein
MMRLAALMTSAMDATEAAGREMDDIFMIVEENP